MKKFCVSKDCNACGECILQTDLLIEDAAGYAVPVADGYIKAENLEKAQAVVAACPAHGAFDCRTGGYRFGCRIKWGLLWKRS